jgi:hypothetical protein
MIAKVAVAAAPDEAMTFSVGEMPPSQGHIGIEQSMSKRFRIFWAWNP